MGKFIVSEDFWDLFPEVEIAIVSAKGISNFGAFLEEQGLEIHELLKDIAPEATLDEILGKRSETMINEWRKSYQNFKTKQNTVYPAENLLKNSANGLEASKINPLKDICNLVSMTYGLPGRNIDIATFTGDMIFARAKCGESYIALGDSEYDNTLPGEIAFIDDDGDICRCWNWREGQRTIQTENTADVFLIIELADPNRSNDLKDAAEELARLIKKYLNGTTEIFYMNHKNKELKL